MLGAVSSSFSTGGWCGAEWRQASGQGRSRGV